GPDDPGRLTGDTIDRALSDLGARRPDGEAAVAMTSYFPAPDRWDRLDPEAAGMDGDLLAEATAFAQASESDWPRSLYLPDGRYVGNAYVQDRPPHDKPIGVVRPRGGASGLIVRHGKLVAEWGD